MENKDLKYFELVKLLNEKWSEELLKKEAHFRGNISSFSLISLNSKTPEIGISKITTEEKAKEELSKFNPKEPERKTPEKSLQAWVILNAIRNDYILPFGKNLTFITSELAIVLEDNKRIVNDILAIDENNNLVIIELKSIRVNQVKEQAIKFKAIIESQKDFFGELTKLMTGKSWNGNVKCMVVLPKANGKEQEIPKKYRDVEEYQYYNKYNFEKRCK